MIYQMGQSKARYKDKHKQALYEAALKAKYPMKLEKGHGMIGGSGAFAFNLGYEGKVKRHPRAAFMSDAYVLFYAGKEKAKIDNKSCPNS